MTRHAAILAATVLLAGPAWGMETAVMEAVAAPTRSADNIARDGARHPVAELQFFGVRPSATVVEIWPGGGYWTQILAPLLHDRGSYYVAAGVPNGDHVEKVFAPSPAYLAMLAGNKAVYGRVRITELGHGHTAIAPAGSADFVLTFRNLHNWLKEGDAPELLRAAFVALKPGGILGIEDHRAATDQPQDPQAKDGYVRQDYAIALIEHAGFRFVKSSEMDANPRDTTHWPAGVWTLPPSFTLGEKDRAKYAAIGEADNFVLKFRKPG